jgi:YbbR domain-containing protein
VLEGLRANLGLKVLALALAVAAWAYFRLTPNPVVAARFVQTLNVPIVTTGLKADKVARFSERQAVVSVVVPRSGEVKPDDLRAVLDLEGRGVGVYNVPVEVIAPKLDIRSLSPASVTLSIERIEERRLTVSVRYVGQVRRSIVVDRVVLSPAAVVLRGPTSDLDHVAGVRVDLPLPSTAAPFDAMLKPVATNAAGNELATVDVEPNLIRVRAEFGTAARVTK